MTSCVALAFTGCVHPIHRPQLANWETEAKRLFATKETQARGLAKEEAEESGEPKEMAPEVWPFFEAGKRGDWDNARRLYDQMRPRSYQFAANEQAIDDRFSSTTWQPVNETYRFLAQCSAADSRHLLDYGREVISSIPAGSIYLCGSDAGRFVITGLCGNQPAGDPIFVVSPNQMSDGIFLRYLESMYADKIFLLTADDSQTAFKDYMEDAERRSKENKLKTGEFFLVTNGMTQVQGMRAVFEIAARLTRTLFEKNPSRNFYVDFVNDGFPIEWMYPHLLPHGPTLRINHEPLGELGHEAIERDRAYWTKRVALLLGDWLKDETPISEVCRFAETVYVRKNLIHFRGDTNFVMTARSWHRQAAHLGASAVWGHARAAIASVYLWRVLHAKTVEEKRQMMVETDFAFRQAFALCPYSRETVFSFVSHLLTTGRAQDAIEVAKIAVALNPEECGELSEQLKAIAKEPLPKP